MPQPAYNLNNFAPRQPAKRALRLEVKKTKNARRIDVRTLRTIKIVATATILLALVCSVIYSQTLMTEYSVQMTNAEKQLVEVRSEYTYYNNELSMRTNMETVQSYALQKGLMKMDKSQITYINTGAESKIMRNETAIDKFFAMLSTVAMNAMEYISP